MSSLPKAVLYYSPVSIWSSARKLSYQIKGYGRDEVDLKQVDLSRGENYDVAYLRINSKATVPALVVPLENTLSGDVESRYKAITDSKSIVEFLDKSRSTNSKTHSTSHAPAPALAPATVSYTNISNRIITLVHSDAADPNNLKFVNAYDDASLHALAQEALPGIVARRQVLEKYLGEAGNGALRVSDKVVKLWQDKKVTHDRMYDVLRDADVPVSELDPDAKTKREQFFQIASQAWQVDLKEIVLTLSNDIIGPFALGDQFSIADVHVAVWLGRVMHLCGVTADDDGRKAVEKLEKRMGQEQLLPREVKRAERKGDEGSKLEVFWETVKERPSWKKVYGSGLH
ncbi:hypothetical protein M378DRAFT_67122 [Amanita muscaria Koide BX008]|uniref:Uncharacterized protein n=1 Tax=Amanita muscaria (strain Koide BX008) TaxID=946122 RepID=A0A0C2X8Y8_AMAMK|nr:hypothetical protein M378DRAFT_67122 [Amanita muscaria Koide BX008]